MDTLGVTLELAAEPLELGTQKVAPPQESCVVLTEADAWTPSATEQGTLRRRFLQTLRGLCSKGETFPSARLRI